MVSPGLFVKFFEKHGIFVQYTMLCTLQQNGVLESHNKTLMDIIRSKMSNSSLSTSLWMYALKTTMYLLNRVPIRVAPKIPFELWIGRKPNSKHCMLKVVRQK